MVDKEALLKGGDFRLAIIPIFSIIFITKDQNEFDIF